MPDNLAPVLRGLGYSTEMTDLLVNVLVVLKLQQMNIDLLWEAQSSGRIPDVGVARLRESNRRLTESMEQMVSALVSGNQVGNVQMD